MRLSSLRPSYARRRINQILFARRVPDAPWLPECAVKFLDAWLRPADVGLEWGSGRSTVWLARRVKHLFSVEHDESWYNEVKSRLVTAELADKVDYRYVQCDLTDADEMSAHDYVGGFHDLAHESLDFAVVDGRVRLSCMDRAKHLLKSTGLLILDNANRYVPNRFGNEYTTVHAPRDEPATLAWASLLEELSDWRGGVLSDGIWDTRIWIKP